MEEQVASLEIRMTGLAAVNLALQQHKIPPIREILLKNISSAPIERVECVLSTASGLFPEVVLPLDRLDPGAEHAFRDPPVVLDYVKLSRLSEPVHTDFSLVVRVGDTVLHSSTHAFDAMAVDQWLGLDIFPELLAAFVMPNLACVDALLPLVADELAAATGSAAIVGYQGGRTRAYEICTAVYRVIHAQGIHYACPPASYHIPGQRIRLPDQILEQRVATCLDFATLFASVLEQCGLHPVLLLQNGHAYVGCHLADTYFPDLPVDELQAVRKAVDADEFVVFETTLAAGEATFAEAEAEARRSHLNLDDEFHCAVDVVRARYSGIRPLPVRRDAEGRIEIETADAKISELDSEIRRDFRSEVDLASLRDQPETRAARLVRWRQRLLDLSLRNRLLNARDGKLVVPLVCPDITALEDRLAANQAISVLPVGELLGEKDVHDIAMLRGSNLPGSVTELLNRELGERRLRAALTEKDLRGRLTALYRQCRLDLEEGGVNTLFLAIGFLEWKVSPREARSYLAPILLVPIRVERRSMAEGIRIARLDEDTVVNVTLLELLRREHHLEVPGLHPLPTDASGVDVARVLQIFRQVVRDQPGWEVREEARIGQFSFAKFIMWNDLTTRTEELEKNPLVHHLMEGDGLFDDGVPVFPPEELSGRLDPSRLFCPMSADASQLAAVLLSGDGKTFVLHGPPGTGKSQTITNLIAHNLALGRRVLFVSEKKAALDVVHRRLASVGLGPFCLELHSNRSGKTEVLRQFSEALNVAAADEPAEWRRETASLAALRDELGGYVAALHRVYPNGLSAYLCLSRVLSAPRDIPDDTGLSGLLVQSAEDFETQTRLGAALAAEWRDVDPAALADLSWLDLAEWSPVFERDLRAATLRLRDALKSFSDAAETAVPLLGVPLDGTLARLRAVAALAQTALSSGPVPESLLVDSIDREAGFLLGYAKDAARRDALRERFADFHEDALCSLAFSGLEQRLQQNRRKNALFRFFANRSLLRELGGLKKPGAARLTIPELREILPEAEEFSRIRARCEKDAERAREGLGPLWADGHPAADALGPQTEAARALLKAARASSPDSPAAVLAALRPLLRDTAALADGTDARRRLDAAVQSAAAFEEALAPYPAYSSASQGESAVDALASRLTNLLGRLPALRAFLRYGLARRDAEAAGLARLAGELESGRVAQDDFPDFLATARCKTMLDEILAESPELSRFSGTRQEERIREFCRRDDEYLRLTRRLIFARLSASLPRRRTGPCPEDSELGILRRECEKHARQKPVRMLLEQLPTLVPALKPCFLMSPLSVAQYLPAGTAPFDLVVFDEASQIPVWDAIGAIARGKQLVVVGDPRQMPPTNFFQKTLAEGDEDTAPDEVEDLESILDECLAAGLHSAYLNWHYRSRHESLISFSNHYYYEDRLFTFPAASTSDRLGVRFRFVPDGVYDRRRSRTNPREAQALVDYVVERLSDASRPRRSVGIVTFSEAQRDLIEDLLEQARNAHPELEPAFSDEAEEPFFVKNLENVQGDERDVILFSVGYAPDSDGRFALNFGPLNRQGGDRRLNVAVTRAKEQVVVFSSVHGSQIDLSRTAARGAAHLRYFLEFAEKGLDIGRSAARPGEDGLAESVAGFLAGRGYEAVRDIGTSFCKVDVAVRHPDRPDEYLLGIECDGERYAAQRTARDRDHLRPSVLRGMGWRLFHIWSMDWEFDRERTEARLLEALESARAEPEAGAEEPAPPAAPNAVAEPTALAAESTAPAKAGAEAEAPRYTPWSAAATLSQGAFYETRSRTTIKRQNQEILDREAPVYERVLRRRVLAAWGFTRAGGNIQEILTACIPAGVAVTEFDGERILWSASCNPGDFRGYRVPGDDESAKRTIDEIPPEELANAMAALLTDFGACGQDSLFRETIRMFGLSSVTQKARRYLEAALALVPHK